MIYKIDNTGKLNNSIYQQVGRPLSEKEDKLINVTGSCLFNLRNIQFLDKKNEFQLEPNARCNFELFENGLLLRINDRQHYYVLPLSKNENLKMTIKEGEEKIFPINLTGFLHAIGFKRSFLRKYWLLSGGFYNERLELLIETDSEIILLDSQGKNFNGVVKYFQKSELITIIATQNQIDSR
jgi:hypothetical protein